jgi:hypothetical protein
MIRKLGFNQFLSSEKKNVIIFNAQSALGVKDFPLSNQVIFGIVNVES